MVLEES